MLAIRRVKLSPSSLLSVRQYSGDLHDELNGRPSPNPASHASNEPIDDTPQYRSAPYSSYSASSPGPSLQPGTSFGRGWEGGVFGSGSPALPSYETAHAINSLKVKLERRLGPEYLSTRAGFGGAGKLTYVEGYKMINLANEVFGFNGWSSTVMKLETDFIDYNETTQKYTVCCSAVIRITLRDGTWHEDVGSGSSEFLKSKAASIESAKKECVTDGIKRALRSFGNVMGNCLYDKDYNKEVAKIKVTPAKFDPKELYRSAENDELNTRERATHTSITQ